MTIAILAFLGLYGIALAGRELAVELIRIIHPFYDRR